MANFDSKVIQFAQQVQSKYNVPASVTLGAYAYESGYGTSSLAKKNNNYFGITGSGTAGSTLGSSHKWAKYNSMEESFDAFGKLLSSKKYSSLTSGATNLNEYVRAYADIYAPPSDGNVSYADNLIKIISSNNLTQYDNGSLGGVVSGDTVSADVDKVGFFENIARNVSVALALIIIALVAVFTLYKTFE